MIVPKPSRARTLLNGRTFTPEEIAAQDRALVRVEKRAAQRAEKARSRAKRKANAKNR